MLTKQSLKGKERTKERNNMHDFYSITLNTRKQQTN